MTYRKKINRMWSNEEEALLAKMWVDPDITKEDLQKVFHYRSWQSIDSHARKSMKFDNFIRYRLNKMNLEHLKEIGKVYDIL